MNSANKTWIWKSKIAELQKWFPMMPNSNSFPGNWTSKIHFLSFARAFRWVVNPSTNFFKHKNDSKNLSYFRNPGTRVFKLLRAAEETRSNCISGLRASFEYFFRKYVVILDGRTSFKGTFRTWKYHFQQFWTDWTIVQWNVTDQKPNRLGYFGTVQILMEYLWFIDYDSYIIWVIFYKSGSC